MNNYHFVLLLALVLTIILNWAFRTLTRERWQIMAVIPWRKTSTGQWIGLNLTFYGFFIASAQTFALIILFILMGSIAIPIRMILSLTLSLLLIGVPASWLIAALVEKKRFTFTVGGASLVGLIAAPIVILVFNQFNSGYAVPPLPTMAAISIAYLFGEGTGRLACISFGCCYGKPLYEAPRIIQSIFESNFFSFNGKTKKIAYESGLDGVAVIPIQAITSTLLIGCGLLTTLFFLEGWFHLAFAIAIFFTHIWRIISETLRADFRGGGRFSSYQRMSLIALGCGLVLLFVLPIGSPVVPTLGLGLAEIWRPLVLIVLQILWAVLFLATGSSMVTGSTTEFTVRRDRV